MSAFAWEESYFLSTASFAQTGPAVPPTLSRSSRDNQRSLRKPFSFPANSSARSHERALHINASHQYKTRATRHGSLRRRGLLRHFQQNRGRKPHHLVADDHIVGAGDFRGAFQLQNLAVNPDELGAGRQVRHPALGYAQDPPLESGSFHISVLVI